jgi:hypothetical protein
LWAGAVGWGWAGSVCVHYHLIAPSKPLGLDLILRYEQDQIRQLIELGYEDAKQVLEGCV